eukprot:TRINITY_DN11554_c0_g1_i1.p1 TRINITY_DN11554_c0_g1~~TRINITY_DN11554_c0_g1_i1.p1  ORF type:complete len:377 (-),score=60.30 TRINITY_DN11554_c0_g1_i1:12-1043(-)
MANTDKIQGKTFLVTGGTGFLGLELCKQLIERGASLKLIARHKTDQVTNLAVEFIEGSILDQELLYHAASNVDGIFHIAGLVVHSRNNPTPIYETNVNGTLNVMKAAQAAQCRVVYASTSGTVGCSKDSKFFAHDASPYCSQIVERWPYYHSKIKAEIAAKQFAQRHSVELIILRPSMILGPGDYTTRSTRLVYGFLAGKLVTPSGGISFVDVRDVATVFINAMIKGVPGKSYLLASYNGSLREWFELLSELSGKAPPTYLGNLPAPIWLFVVKLLDFWKTKIKGARDPTFDPVKAEMSIHFWNVYASAAYADLDFRPQDPKQTLLDTLNWIQENTNLYQSKL